MDYYLGNKIQCGSLGTWSLRKGFVQLLSSAKYGPRKARQHGSTTESVKTDLPLTISSWPNGTCSR